jgi:hypothetical protein
VTTTPALARTSHEAYLHMDLIPCGCGNRGGETISVTTQLPDGGLGRRYTRTCHRCGVATDFLYRLPAEPLDAAGFAYGGDEPSELLDAAQWWWAADRYAAAVPANAADLSPEDRRVARGRLAAAVAAIDEILKFVPPGEDQVPGWAVWTPMGEAVRAVEGERLDAGRLGAVRAAYAEALRAIPDPDGADAALAEYRRLRAGLGADDARLREVQRAFAAWARRYGIDDRDWSADGWAGDDRRSPTAEQAWEFLRTVRTIADR